MVECLSRLLQAERAPLLGVALTERGTVTWADFIARVAAWAAALRAQPGQRWGLYTEDTLEAAVRLWGAWAAGKTVVLPGDGLPETVSSVTAVVSGWLAGGVAPMPEPGPSLEAPPAIADEWPVLEVFTSGSTGQPVAIPKTLRQLDAEIQEIEACWGSAVGEACLVGTVPHQHLYGLLFRLLWPLASGRRFAARRLAFPEEVALALSQRTCALVSSPAFLKRWPAALDLQDVQVPPRLVFSSGGPLPAEASLALQARLGCAVAEIYGSSETGGVAWRVQRGAQTPWQPHRCVDVRIDGADLSIRSPFLPDPQAWLRLDDRVQAVSDGFHLMGRADRIVKVEEKRVSLDALDAALAALPEVEDARSCVLEDGRLGAVLVLSDAGHEALASQGRALFFQSLKHALAGRFEAVALPRRWRTVSALPLNAMGKTPQSLLQGLFDSLRVWPEARCVARGDGQAEFELHVSPDLAAFDGHFPDVPILPGVVQVDWAMHYARASFALDGAFKGVEALKFHHAVRPGDVLKLWLEPVPAKAAVNFRMTRDTTPVASGRLLFGGAV